MNEIQKAFDEWNADGTDFKPNAKWIEDAEQAFAAGYKAAQQVNIWLSDDGSTRYLTPEQYKDLMGRDWVGLVYAKADKNAYGWRVSNAENVLPYEACLCAGNHPEPPDDYRHEVKK